MFTPEERKRYARHLDLPGFGGIAQERLRAGRALVVGCGGLGSPALLYLTAAGVGLVGLVDPDIVDISNLQRQILHTTPDIGRPKTDSALAHLRALNPHVRLDAHPVRLTADNARDLFAPYDIILDATDNYPAKYLINDTCAAMRKPLIHAGIDAYTGQLLTILPGKTPCLRCIFPAPPPSPPLTAGPLSAIPGVIGALQAVEALKHLAQLAPPPTGTLLTYDGISAQFKTLQANRNPACPACGDSTQT